MFFYGYSRRLSSRPSHLTAPNGLNFVRSVTNPNSRLSRLREYLTLNGPRSKREILRDVFGKENLDSSTVRGWGVYLFTYGVHHGFLRKERKGNTVLWSVVK